MSMELRQIKNQVTVLMPNSLEQSIWNTVRYFDLFDMPVTATQIWRCLVRPAPAATLRDISRELAVSGWLRGKIGQRWGYYYLAGKELSVRRRLNRHVLAQHKWQIVRRTVCWLAYVPFVNMIAGSGSLALDNTRPESDLDIFLVVTSERIWLARLMAIVVAQLTGRRRKYWDQLAPDKICLNHYLADQSLLIPAAIHNLFTAVAYTCLVPLYGPAVFERFKKLNTVWIGNYLTYPSGPTLSHRYTFSLNPIGQAIKQLVENWLGEPAMDWLERGAQTWQERLIYRHTDPTRGGRVAISATELAFHPDSKVDGILQQFALGSRQEDIVV